MSIILDQEEDQIKNDRRSKKSFRYFIYAIILFFILLLIYLTRAKWAYEFLYNINWILGLLFFGLSVLGFKNTIQCLIAKENWSVFKMVGLVGNFIISGIVVGLFYDGVPDAIKVYLVDAYTFFR